MARALADMVPEERQTCEVIWCGLPGEYRGAQASGQMGGNQ